jgi:hypothetical protein
MRTKMCFSEKCLCPNYTHNRHEKYRHKQHSKKQAIAQADNMTQKRLKTASVKKNSV